MSKIVIKDSISVILKEIKILDFISNEIPVKKIGIKYYANCPFHIDNTPSFLINEEEKYFYCFGCVKHGNIIDFVKKKKGLDTIAALKYIANLYNIQLVYNKSNYNHYDDINKNIFYKTLNKLQNFFEYEFYHQDDTQAKLIEKFLNKRNIKLELIKNFYLGYSPIDKDKWRLFFNTLNKEDLNILIKTGLIKYKNKIDKYCIFQNRLIFPLFDYKGRILGFGGRELSDTNNKYPKYLNSPHNNFFDKRTILYGLSQLLKHDHSPKRILVVEGYLDVISLHQHGIYYALGLLGTCLSNYQLKVLLNITKKIIFCYDGDIAGKKAAWETLKKILSNITDEHEINFIFLPDKEDPHSLINKENLSFQSRIDNAIPFYDFLFNKLNEDIIKSDNIYEKIHFTKKSISLIQTMTSSYFKSYLMSILKQKVEFIDDKSFNYEKKNIDNKKKEYLPNLHKDKLILLISLLIQNPKFYKLALPLLYLLENIKNKFQKLFIYIVSICTPKENQNIDTTEKLFKFFLETKQTDFLFIKKIYSENIFDNLKKDKLQEYFVEIIYSIHIEYLKKQLGELLYIEKNRTLNKDETTRILTLMKRILELKHRKKK